MSVSILNQLFPTRQLVLASNNQGKLAEFKQLFEQANLEITVMPAVLADCLRLRMIRVYVYPY